MAIAEYLKYEIISEDEIGELVEHLKQFCKTLFISNCIKSKYEEENEKKIKEESEIWFDYIFENEEYPR